MNLTFDQFVEALKEVDNNLDLSGLQFTVGRDRLVHANRCPDNPWQDRYYEKLTMDEFLKNPEDHLHADCGGDLAKNDTSNLESHSGGSEYSLGRFLGEVRGLMLKADLKLKPEARTFEENITALEKLEAYQASYGAVKKSNFTKRKYPKSDTVSSEMLSIIKHLVANENEKTADYVLSFYNEGVGGAPVGVLKDLFDDANEVGKADELTALVKEIRLLKKKSSRFILCPKGSETYSKDIAALPFDDGDSFYGIYVAMLMAHLIAASNDEAAPFWQVPEIYENVMKAVGYIERENYIVTDGRLSVEEQMTLKSLASEETALYLNKAYRSTLALK